MRVRLNNSKLMTILRTIYITNIIYTFIIYICFFCRMGIEIHLFLKCLLNTYSWSGAVLGFGDTKVNELDPGCNGASVLGEVDRGAGDCGALIKVCPE